MVNKQASSLARISHQIMVAEEENWEGRFYNMLDEWDDNIIRQQSFFFCQMSGNAHYSAVSGGDRFQKPQMSEKVPAGKKQKKAFCVGDPVFLKRQLSMEWRCQQHRNTGDITGSDCALLPMWENQLDYCLCMCSQIRSTLCRLFLVVFITAWLHVNSSKTINPRGLGRCSLLQKKKKKKKSHWEQQQSQPCRVNNKRHVNKPQLSSTWLEL